MKLQGADALARRLHAIADSTHGYPRDWSDDYVRVARPQIPVVTGKTRRSVAVARATDRGAEITGSTIAVWIDTGTGRHGITPNGRALKFKAQRGTVFSRKVDHPGQRARPYLERSAEEAARRNPLGPRVVDAWNGAA